MAEIRINATGGVKLYDADDSHYAQIVAGTITANVDLLTLNSAGITVLDGAIDFDIASHDTSNGLKLGGTLVTATAAELNIMDGVTSTAAELNIMDGVTSTAAEINLIDGGTARGTTAIVDADGVLINDAGTMRMTTAATLKTYIGGFDVSSITGATALGAVPATTDELVLSDAGTLKRMDFNYIFNTPSFQAYGDATQDLANATATKIAFNTENFDTGSCYDHSTNYRFTPNIAGKYYVYMAGQWGNATDWDGSNPTQIFKNGSQVASLQGRNEYYDTKYLAIVLDMDGSSDYVEAYAQQNSGSTQTFAGDDATRVRFGAFRLVGV